MQSEVSQIEHGQMPQPWHREKWAIAYGMYWTQDGVVCADVERFERLVCESRDGWELPLFRYAIVENGRVEVVKCEFQKSAECRVQSAQ